MKELKDKPKAAFPLYRKKNDEFEIVVTKCGVETWVCGECGIIYGSQWGGESSKDKADNCCLQKYCECGEKLPEHWLKCSTCMRSVTTDKHLEKAVEVTECDGPLFDDSRDRYHSSVEEFLDWAANADPEDRPEWLFPCSIKKFGGLDADSIVESELCEHHEDAELDDMKGLQEFLDKWCDKQTLESWMPDYTRKISTESMLAELDEEQS